MIDTIRNQVGLARKLRDPEAVNHILGLEVQEGGLTDRQMEFVGRDEVIVLVLQFPPPLMSHHADGEAVRRRFILLEDEDPSCGDQAENNDDQDRRDRPGEFELFASIDLGRLPALIARALPVARHGVGQGRRHHDEDAATDENDEKAEIQDIPGRLGHGVEE